MKYLAIIVGVILASVSVSAQNSGRSNEQEKRTLLSDNPLTGGGLSFIGKSGKMANQESLWLGGEVYATFDHNLSLGIAGYGLANTINTQKTDSEGNRLHYQSGYGGIFIEPAIFENRILNISFPVVLGAGGIGETRTGGFIENVEEIDEFYVGEYELYNTDLFWVVEPGAALNLNISRWMKFSAGVSYRYAYDLELPQTSSALLDGFNGNVSLKLGWF